MAAKVKKAYFCRECGYDTSKWLGKCPSCGAWNSFAEEVVAAQSSVPALVASRAIEPARPQKVQDIECGKTVRLDTGNSEVNRVLGGGVVPGSLILLGGEPGIGKSTLSLQLALTNNGMTTLYVSGEESAEQIRLRADRIGIHNENCTVYTETLLENVVAQIETLNPDIVVIDGIADLLYNTNDIEESDNLIGELMALSTQYNCHIINVLHTNPGTDLLRPCLQS